MPKNRYYSLRPCKSAESEGKREKGGLSRFVPYIAAAVAGVTFTMMMIPVVEQQRGYAAVGGEYLFAPLFVLLIIAGRWICAMLKEVQGFDAELDGSEK